MFTPRPAFLLLGTALLPLVSCQTGNIVTNTPAAATPGILSVFTKAKALPATTSHIYELLPIADSAVSIRLTAPYVTELLIDLSGKNLSSAQRIPKRTVRPANAGVGYYMVEALDVTVQPATWTVTVIVPQEFVKQEEWHISVADSSVNPSHVGPAKLSKHVPLVIKRPPPPPPTISQTVDVQVFSASSANCANTAYVMPAVNGYFGGLPANALVDNVENTGTHDMLVYHKDDTGREIGNVQVNAGQVNAGDFNAGTGFGEMEIRGRWEFCLRFKPASTSVTPVSIPFRLRWK